MLKSHVELNQEHYKWVHQNPQQAMNEYRLMELETQSEPSLCQNILIEELPERRVVYEHYQSDISKKQWDEFQQIKGSLLYWKEKFKEHTEQRKRNTKY